MIAVDEGSHNIERLPVYVAGTRRRYVVASGLAEDKAAFYLKRGWRLLEQRQHKGIDVDIMDREL